jgi:cysteine-S-conjugate beta-lyase
VVLPTPAYMPFLFVPHLMDREIIQVPMVQEDGLWVYDLEALDRAFTAGGGLLILCNPHNPLGRVLRRDEMEAISEVVDRHGVRVFSDEVHAPLVYEGYRHVPYASVSPLAAGHTVTATSASKAWNIPGLKCAQLLLSNDDDATTWRRIQGLEEYRYGASPLGAAANVAAYNSGEPWLDDVLGYLDENRRLLGALLSELLPGVGYTMPEGTYLGWLDFRGTGLGDRPAAVLLQLGGVALTDGAECGEAGTGFARINLATTKPILEEMITRIARAAKDL